jgi:ACR3 family arsenite transporter
MPEPLVLLGPSETTLSPKKELDFIEKYLSVWILIAMVGGTLVGVYAPQVRSVLETTKIENVSLPIFIGLLLMLYPVFCKVRYEELSKVSKQHSYGKLLGFSFVINWILGPFLMAALAWITLFDLPGYRSGVLMIGIARCIAMVLIWNELADGDAEWCVVLVAFNSVLQMVLFSPLTYFFTVLIGGEKSGTIDLWPVTKNVLIFLGIPFLAGILTRYSLKKATWFDTFLKIVSPLALLGLLYTIFIMFALQGVQIVNQIGPVVRVAIPLFLYFILMWFVTMFLCNYFSFPFKIAISQSFTAASNNFELAMAIAIATYGVDSQQALATTIGPLVEVPVLLGLVYVCPWVEQRYKTK